MAQNGKEACVFFTESESKFDLVILDMVMPDMGGVETYQQIQKIQPEQPILLYSGYSRELQISEILQKDYTRFLQKPFRNQELLAAMGDLLS